MEYLADTNIYLRLVNKDDPQCGLVSNAVASLMQTGNTLLIASQSVYELWSVATRPASANGLGWTTQQTRSVVDWLTTEFELLPDSPDAYTHWLELVTTHGVSGKPTHDARLVALMRTRGLADLLTLNGADFKRFDINILHPSEVHI
jgi:predicted nucleic acid-binding protein